MADGLKTSMRIEGLDELRRAMQNLPERMQKNVLSKAVNAGALIIRDDARVRVPILKIPDPRRIAGLLRRMVRSTRGVRRGTEASAFVSVRRLTKGAIRKFKRLTGKSGAQNPNDAWYWRFVEFGTSKAPAQPFLRPAFDHQKERAAMAIKDELLAGIEREASQSGGKRFW